MGDGELRAIAILEVVPRLPEVFVRPLSRGGGGPRSGWNGSRVEPIAGLAVGQPGHLQAGLVADRSLTAAAADQTPTAQADVPDHPSGLKLASAESGGANHPAHRPAPAVPCSSTAAREVDARRRSV